MQGKYGYGFVAMGNREIASFALSTSRYGTIHGIGVETLKHHRQKGLSGSLVKTLLRVFNEKGIEAWWDCTESNIASQKTAEKAGLLLDHRYKIYWCKINSCKE